MNGDGGKLDQFSLIPLALFFDKGQRRKELSMKGKKQKVKNGRKNLVLILSGLLVLALFLGSGYFICQYSSQSNPTVATLDGNPISLKEIRMRSGAKQAEVVNYFNEKYKAEYDKNFWHKSFGGEIPIEVLRKRCLKDAVRDNVQLIYAKDQGMVKDIGYDAFLHVLKSENERRKKAVEKKEPVYGPIAYDEAGYYVIWLSNLVEEKVKLYLREGEFKLTEADIQKIYAMNKESKYKLPDIIKVEKITVDFSGEKDISRAITDGKAYACHIRSLYAKGAAFEELEKSSRSGTLVLKREEVVFDMPEKGYLYSIVRKMKVKDISEVLSGPDQLYFIRCISRNESGYKKYSEVKESIEKDYVNEKYDALIKKRSEEAKVEVDQAKLNLLEI